MGERGSQVIIQASRPFSYSLSNHDRPPRVSVDIPEGRFAELPRRISVQKGVIQAISLQERQGQAQVEVALERLEKMLGQGYIKRPQVSVTVREYRSKGVSVLGAVNKPGAYYLWGGRMTLLELLSVAGGVSLEEGGKSLILLRPDEKGETKSIMIDLDRLLKEGDPSANVNVQPNDAIYVAKADSIIVYGEVQKPGPYPIESGGMTILEAVSRAGCFTKFAAPTRTRIVRVDEGVEKTIRVRVGDIVAKGERTREFFLQAGDVIVVPEGYF